MWLIQRSRPNLCRTGAKIAKRKKEVKKDFFKKRPLLPLAKFRTGYSLVNTNSVLIRNPVKQSEERVRLARLARPVVAEKPKYIIKKKADAKVSPF